MGMAMRQCGDVMMKLWEWIDEAFSGENQTRFIVIYAAIMLGGIALIIWSKP